VRECAEVGECDGEQLQDDRNAQEDARDDEDDAGKGAA
jgi:hypothetical protein